MSIQSDVAAIKERQAVDSTLLQALHLTQNHQTSMLIEHGRKLDEHSRVLDAHGQTLAEHGLLLSNLQGGVERIIDMLDTLIDREN